MHISGKWFLSLLCLTVMFVSLVIIVPFTQKKTPKTETGAACIKCSGTNWYCSDNWLYRCIDKCLHFEKCCDSWCDGYGGDQRTCNATQKTCTNRCVDGSDKCVEDSNGMERYEACINDRWYVTEYCRY